MWVKYPLVAIALFIALVLQAGLFAHIPLMGAVPNLVFAVFFLVIFFEETNSYYMGIFSAVAAGFLLDAASPLSFGPSLITLSVVYAVIKTIKHFLRDQEDSYLLLYFAAMFLISILFYISVFSALYHFPNVQAIFDLKMVVEALYSLVFVVAGFFAWQKVSKKPDRQLKLFV